MFRSYFNVYRDNIFDKKKFIEFSMKAFVSAYQTRPYRREYFKPKLYFTETNWGVTSKLNKVMFRHGSGGGIPALKRAWCYNGSCGEDDSQCPAASSQANIFISLSLSPYFCFQGKWYINVWMICPSPIYISRRKLDTYSFDLSTQNLGIGQNQLSVGPDNLHWMF